MRVPARLRRIAVTALVASIGATGGIAAAATGDLDPTFGEDGLAIVVGPNIDEHGFGGVDVSPNESGAVWTVGTSSHGYTGGLGRAVITKLRPNGEVARSFGHGGQKVWRLSGRGEYPSTGSHDVEAVEEGVQIFGKFSPTSSSSDPSTSFFARFGADGRPDATFGTRGVVRHRFPDFTQVISATGPDGLLMCARVADKAPPINLRIWRHTLDGAVDETFGVNGRARVPMPAIDSGSPLSCGAGDHGSTLAVFEGNMSNEHVVLVIRLLANGAVDPQYGNDGIATLQAPDFVSFTSATIERDGGIVLAGTQYRPAEEEHVLTLWAIDRSGQPDSSFGDEGLVVADLPELRHTYVTDAPRRTADGSILVLSGGALARFTPSGALDATFGGDGAIAVPALPATNFDLDPRGRIVLGGDHPDPKNTDDAAVARLQR